MVGQRFAVRRQRLAELRRDTGRILGGRMVDQRLR